MPKKNGFECLKEIKQHENLKQLPVIIYSTSFEQGMIDLLYDNGAQYYIQKPTEFLRLKEVIQKALIQTQEANKRQPPREKFIL